MAEPLRFPRTMGNTDALLWAMERDPVLRATTAAVTLLAEAPDRELLIEKLRRASLEIPRLRQRVVELPAWLSTPVWVRDPDFDLDYHVRWVRAPRDGSLRALLDLAASLAMQGFDRIRPLWEIVVVEDLADGRAALVQKLHHSVADGIAGLMLMQRVYDTAADAPLRQAESAEPAAGNDSAVRLGLEAIARRVARQPGEVRARAGRLLAAARSPVQWTRDTLAEAASMLPLLTPALEAMSPLMQRRSTRFRFESLCVPVDELQAAARAAQCKLNDAFLAALAGGWRLYHERHDVEVERLRVLVPINLRGAGGARAAAGNRLSLARIPIPIREPDPRRRMREIHELVARERARPAATWMEPIAALLNQLPSGLLTLALGSLSRSTDFVASCVPGPADPLYVAGARVDTLFAFGPPAGAAANLTLFRYVDEAAITINADAAAVPDSGVLAECMRDGFNEVTKLA